MPQSPTVRPLPWGVIGAVVFGCLCILAFCVVPALPWTNPPSHSRLVIATATVTLVPTVPPTATDLPIATAIPTATVVPSPYPHVVITILCGTASGSCVVPYATSISVCSSQICGRPICRVDNQIEFSSGSSINVGCSFVQRGDPRQISLVNACVLQQTVPYTNQTICYAFVTAEVY